jgi:hypothetical protein
MRKTSILALAIAGVFVAYGVLPVAAQSILGLSLRATDELPSGTARGTADIVADKDGQYKVSVDLSAAADSLKLADYPGAKAFLVWAVDTNGVRHNLGTLDGSLTLKDVAAAYAAAKLYVTAEADSAAAAPAGKPLFAATLRNVTEVEATATPAGAEAAKSGGAESAAPQATAVKAAEAKPNRMPTTGNELPDVLVVVAVAIGLLVLGLRLRAVRF